MKNKIDDLRDHLFEQLERLKDAETPEAIALEIDRATAVADVGRTIIDSAKVEVDFLKVTGRDQATDFLPVGVSAKPALMGAPRTCQSCAKVTRGDPCEHCKAPLKKVALAR